MEKVQFHGNWSVFFSIFHFYFVFARKAPINNCRLKEGLVWH
jgi:hypothetical protein